MKINQEYIKRFSNIVILELVTLSFLIIVLTVLRFFTPKLFGELKEVYKEYVLVETDISLVLGGEEN